MHTILSLLKNMKARRRMIWDLAKADFRKRFVGSYFGIVWMFIQPLVTIAIYAFIFGPYGFKSAPPVPDVSYTTWLIPGIVPWFFFSEVMNMVTGILLVIFFYLAVLLAAVLGDRSPGQGPGGCGLKTLSRIWLAVTPLLLCVAILLTMLSAYTPKRTDYALGVQGRYFLPALPMLLCTLTGGRPGGGERWISRLLLAELFVSLGLLLYFFVRICGTV